MTTEERTKQITKKRMYINNNANKQMNITKCVDDLIWSWAYDKGELLVCCRIMWKRRRNKFLWATKERLGKRGKMWKAAGVGVGERLRKEEKEEVSKKM